MSTSLSKDLAIEIVETISQLLNKGFKLNGTPSAITAAGDILNITRSAVYSRYVTAQKKYGLKVKIDKNFTATTAHDIDSASERMLSQERQKYQDLITQLRRELRDAHRTINSGETLRTNLFGLAQDELNPPKWTLRQESKKKNTGIPILFTSDFHWGEVIQPTLTSNNNQYNTDIAGKRYRNLIERTICICNRQSEVEYPGIVYLRGGDTISGDIHEELKITNEITSINQLMEVAEVETWGISNLAEQYGEVWVISVPGNHSRNTLKPMHKIYSDTNYDYLISYMLEKRFAHDERIHFYTPASGDAFFSIFGWNYAMTHGDRIGTGGGQGFIGVGAPIIRGVKKFRDSFAVLGYTFDHTFLGHFHTAMSSEDFTANGTLAGYSEYGQSLRAPPAPPSQTLLFVENNIGIGGRHLVYVGDLQPRDYEDRITVG